MMEPLLSAWQTNCRINAYLVETLTPEQWDAPLAKGKSVQNQFAHIHNVRLMWIKASAPDLMEGMQKLDGPASPEAVVEALQKSGDAVAAILERAGEPQGRIRGFKPDAAGFLCYLVAHESFHRAQAELALRQAGIPLNDKVAYGLWEWGSR